MKEWILVDRLGCDIYYISMFYTKYRPQKFSETSRNSEAVDALPKQIASNKTVHGYLLVGPRGTGKTSTARILAKALNCLKIEDNGDPCDKCTNCKSVKTGSFIDLIEIDAASNRGIDDIREIKNKINLAPSVGKNKIYIIDEVHMLTPPAFNALLKTLEEPPNNTTFILCTTEVHKVPDTIKSRCQVFRFKRASISQLVEKLEKISKKEKAKLDKKDLEKIALASMGGFRDAETILQQVIEGEIDVDVLTNFSSKDKFFDFTDYLINNDSENALRLINDVYEEGVDLYIWVGEYLKYLRDLLFIKAGFSEIDVPSELLDEMKKQAKNVNTKWLANVLNALVDAHTQIKKSVIPQLPIEISVIDIVNVSDEEDTEEGDIESKKKPLNTKKEEKEKKPQKKDEEEEEDEDDKKLVTKVEIEDSEEGEEEDENENETKEEDVTEEFDSPVIELSAVEGKWTNVLGNMKEVNGPILAILRSAKPLRIEGKFLILEVYYAFHKERLESLRNRKKLEEVLNEVYGIDMGIRCDLSKEKPKKLKKRETGELTDANIKPVNASEIMNVFDGGLPL